MNRSILKDWRKLPNLISLSRAIFIPLIIFLFNSVLEWRWYLITSLIVFSLLDNLDGYVARRRNEITEFGKIIDPLIDKIFVITFIINLYYYDLVPYWFISLVILRDLIIILVGGIFINKIKKVPVSDFIGKMTVGAIGIVFILTLLDFQKFKMFFDLVLYICTFLIFLSLINYGYKQIFKKQ